MKNLKATLILTAVVSACIGLNTITADAAQCRVAVVNVQAVVESSAEVAALKKEQQQKMQELQKWLTTVRADVDKQSTKAGKEKLVKKYDEEFAKKQAAIRANYSKKLQAIDQNITNVIEQERKLQGYDLVLTKGSVLSGGTDITAAVAKKVK